MVRTSGIVLHTKKPFSSDKLLQGLLSNLADLERTWYGWIRMSKIFIKCQPSVVI